MQYTTLGRTGLKVSVAGLGCGGNSRIGLGAGLSEAQSVALVREALDLGVNVLDTAAAYETEGVVGKAIAGRRRDGVVISTKAHVTTAPEVVASLEASLRRLGTDYVDIFLLHGLAPAGRASCATWASARRARAIPSMPCWRAPPTTRCGRWACWPSTCCTRTRPAPAC
jgi:aryl-alcohol dehydrogenase-like predicted oxidoreductase